MRTTDSAETEQVGEILGSLLKTPEIIELRSDLGGGKTTFAKGLVKGLGSGDKVASPTFTLKKVYKADRIEVHHFDFYRLHEPGLVSVQLEESIKDPKIVTVVEWADIVKGVLPEDRITIEFKPVADNPDERVITFEFPSSKMEVVEKLRNKLADSKP
jgi:tRNA threonylcarbamoyladenosine biosynthesis protein TsaE